jgi:hypothetical protein
MQECLMVVIVKQLCSKESRYLCCDCSMNLRQVLSAKKNYIGPFTSFRLGEKRQVIYMLKKKV